MMAASLPTVWRKAAPPHRAVVCADLHLGDGCDDPHAVALLESFLLAYDPAAIYCLGDLLNFDTVSRHPTRLRDAEGRRVVAAPDALQDQLDRATALLSRWRHWFPHAELALLAGNHEDRLEAYLADHAPELRHWRGTDLPAMLDLAAKQIIWKPYKEGLLLPWGGPDGLWLTHGAYTSAAAELRAWRRPGLSGHIHRAEESTARLAGRGPQPDRWQTWASLPCLCDLNPHYTKGPPNWRQGFAVLEWYADLGPAPWGHLERYTVYLDNGRLVWADQTCTLA